VVLQLSDNLDLPFTKTVGGLCSADFLQLNTCIISDKLIVHCMLKFCWVL